jgi:hypothetical protein
MRQQLQAAGFATKRSIPVSFFRIGILKNLLPTGLLAGMDGVLQLSGLHYTPSIFTRNIATGDSANNLETDSLFVCPDDGHELTRVGDTLMCKSCGQRWAIRDGIYDFKAPLEE